jgi:hypothetical protein
VLPLSASAQTITDGLMMQKKDLCAGLMFSQDKWTNYWEGELKRENESIGTFTSKSVMLGGVYGVTDKINVFAMLPYVKNSFNNGTLREETGLQDLTLAVKYNFFTVESGGSRFKTFAGLAFSTPMSDYTPDYFPLSLGTQTTNLSWRMTGNFKLEQGFYATASGAYTWRSNTNLDRTSYYYNGKLYMTDEVKMSNVFDYTVSLGYVKRGFQAELFYMQQNTLGGNDIRRQDMPFVSNRMNFSKAGFLALYYLPKPKGFAVTGNVKMTVAGRNVGESTTLTGGILYTIHFGKSEPSQAE